MLDSAAHRPSSSLFGREAYLTIHEKAAALLESLVRNDPLVDGNKRLGWLSIVVFFRVNGWDLDAPDNEECDLVIAAAMGRSDIASGASRLETWATRA
ncbi:MAG: type II toxin-antitoxin system death-on-curing family toxin [Rhodoglobus sp.]